jgi:hypothetical protein
VESGLGPEAVRALSRAQSSAIRQGVHVAPVHLFDAVCAESMVMRTLVEAAGMSSRQFAL